MYCEKYPLPSPPGEKGKNIVLCHLGKITVYKEDTKAENEKEEEEERTQKGSNRGKKRA
jgi:hypothetical protein